MGNQTSEKLMGLIEAWRPRLLQLAEDTVRYQPSPDRWAIAEVLGHLVDSACNNHQRFVRAQQADELTFPKYDQGFWVRAAGYGQADWANLVTLWHSYNHMLAQMIRQIPAKQLATPCTITPYDTCTLQFLVEDYVVHLEHHLLKIDERLESTAA